MPTCKLFKFMSTVFKNHFFLHNYYRMRKYNGQCKWWSSITSSSSNYGLKILHMQNHSPNYTVNLKLRKIWNQGAKWVCLNSDELLPLISIIAVSAQVVVVHVVGTRTEKTTRNHLIFLFIVRNFGRSCIWLHHLTCFKHTQYTYIGYYKWQTTTTTSVNRHFFSGTTWGSWHKLAPER